MRLIHILSCFMLSLALACSPKAGPDAVSDSETASEPVSDSQPASHSDRAPAEPPSPTPSLLTAPALPEPVLTCATDDDCVVTWSRSQTDAGQCCRGCAPVAGNKAWHDSATAACESMGTEGCKVKRCAPLPGVRCEAGQCRLEPAG